MHDVFSFVWFVETLGYRWVGPDEVPRRVSEMVDKPRWEMDQPPYLTSRISSRLGDRRYQPLRERRTLFRAFAYLEPTLEAIQGFASEFGLLGGDAHVLIDTQNPPQVELWAEPLAAWTAEINAMRTLLTLSDCARAGDISQLRELIQVLGPSDAKVVWTVGEARVLSRAMEPRIAKTVGTEDLGSFATEYVRQSINRRLGALSVPQLEPDKGDHRLPLSVGPVGLLGMLWLQFARSLDGKDYRRCRQCGEWFEISRAAGTRSTKQFCSGACRFKTHREKKTSARTSTKPKKRTSSKRAASGATDETLGHRHNYVALAPSYYKIRRDALSSQAPDEIPMSRD